MRRGTHRAGRVRRAAGPGAGGSGRGQDARSGVFAVAAPTNRMSRSTPTSTRPIARMQDVDEGDPDRFAMLERRCGRLERQMQDAAGLVSSSGRCPVTRWRPPSAGPGPKVTRRSLRSRGRGWPGHQRRGRALSLALVATWTLLTARSAALQARRMPSRRRSTLRWSGERRQDRPGARCPCIRARPGRRGDLHQRRGPGGRRGGSVAPRSASRWRTGATSTPTAPTATEAVGSSRRRERVLAGQGVP